MGKTYFTYIMSNKSRRLYVGATSELQARVFKHKNKWYEGSFTARYRFDMLVYFETYAHPSEAIEREKEIKGWRREKKLRLILAVNPDWADLSAEWKDDESWQAIPEARSRPVLRPRSRNV
jgi:putative endonuclease